MSAEDYRAKSDSIEDAKSKRFLQRVHRSCYKEE